MGLSADIKKAFFDVMDEDVLDQKQKRNLDRMSKDLSKAIIDFLTEQTWTITEMKALLEVEEIKTSTTLPADVLANRLRTTVSTAGSAAAQTGTGISQESPRAVRIPSLELRKFGGQGGAMTAVGHAYIGRNPVDSEESNEDLTKVKLLDENIVGR